LQIESNKNEVLPSLGPRGCTKFFFANILQEEEHLQ
jgi:hypothetical protein